MPDAEGISCVAGLLKGFRMLLSKKNSSKDSEGFPMEKVTNITEGQISHTSHCCTQTSAHKYKEKKSFQLWNSEPIVGVGGGRKGLIGQYIPLYPICTNWAEKAKRNQVLVVHTHRCLLFKERICKDPNASYFPVSG